MLPAPSVCAGGGRVCVLAAQPRERLSPRGMPSAPSHRVVQCAAVCGGSCRGYSCGCRWPPLPTMPALPHATDGSALSVPTRRVHGHTLSNCTHPGNLTESHPADMAVSRSVQLCWWIGCVFTRLGVSADLLTGWLLVAPHNELPVTPEGELPPATCHASATLEGP